MNLDTTFARNLTGTTEEELTESLFQDLLQLASNQQDLSSTLLYRLAPEIYLAAAIDTESNSISLGILPENTEMWGYAFDPIRGDVITFSIDALLNDNPESRKQLKENYLLIAISTTFMMHD